jgi:O-antigen/teichoic acid export membrane protein
VWTLGLAFAAGAGAGLAALAPKLPELGAATEPAAARELLAEGWPFLGLALAMQLLFRLDLFLLAALGRSREEIGFYGAAATVVWGLLTLPQLFALAVYPTLSRSALGPSRPRRQALASAALGGGLGTMLAAGLWLAREPLVALAFGPGFAPAAPLLATLAWALPGACAAMLLGTVLAAWRGQRLALALQGAAVAASLAGNLGSIPGQGALGAAGTAVLVHGGLGLGLLAALLALRTGGPAPPPSPAPPPAGP